MAIGGWCRGGGDGDDDDDDVDDVGDCGDAEDDKSNAGAENGGDDDSDDDLDDDTAAALSRARAGEQRAWLQQARSRAKSIKILHRTRRR